MFKVFLSVTTLVWLTGCSQPNNKPVSAEDRVFVPEPDKDLRKQYEANQKLKESGCFFLNPDTSLSNIKLRDPKSTMEITGDGKNIKSSEQYHYYSKMDRETLTLIQHPGDGKYAVSIFKIEYSDKADYGYRQLQIDTFKTEKGIKLGLNKKQLIGRLGNCYVAKDSTKESIELSYRLEQPQDSKTALLSRQNMQAYYASYQFCKDRLERFEFGFKYP